MADAKRTIEILLQIKEAGAELLKALPATIDQVTSSLVGAQAASTQFAAGTAQAFAQVNGPAVIFQKQVQETHQALQQAQAPTAGFKQEVEGLKSSFAAVNGPAVTFGQGIDSAKTAFQDVKGPAVSFQQTVAATGTTFAQVRGPVVSFGGELASAGRAFTGFSAVARAALTGVEVAAEATWSAITFGVSAIVKAFSTVAGFFNPLSLKGLVTGAAFGGAGLVAKEWLEAADAVEVYRKQLGVITGDQAVANRIFDRFEAVSQQTGIDAEKLSETFTQLYQLRVRDAEQATVMLSGVSAFLHKDVDDLLAAITNPNSRGLKRLGIDLNDLGSQAELVAGQFRVVVDKTEENLRQGVIELLSKEFPNAMNDAQASFTTQMAILRVNLGQFAQDFGAILLPEATRALQKINEFLAENRDQIVAFIRSIPDLARQVYAQISALLDSGHIATILAPLVATIGDLVQNLIAHLMDVLIAAIKLAAVPVVATWRVLLEELQTAWEVFTENLIPTLVNSVKHNIAAAGGSTAGQVLLDAVIPGARAAASLVPDLPVKPMVDSAVDFLHRLDASLDQSVKDAKEKIAGLVYSIKSLFTDLRSDAGDVWGVFRTLFGQQLTQLGTTVQNTLEAMRAKASQNRSAAQAPAPPALPIDEDLRFRLNQAITNDVFKQQEDAIREKYRRELEQLKNDLQGKQDAENLYEQARVGIAKKEANELSALEGQKVIAAQQAQVAVTTGFQKMVEENQLSYLQDLENWRKRMNDGQINSDQFVSIQIQLTRKMVEANRQAADQIAQSQSQLQELVLQSQHRMVDARLVQIEDEARRERSTYEKLYADGIINFQEYQDALTAIATQSADKRLEEEGTFFDGIQLGFQKAVDGMLTPARLGEQAVSGFAGKLADTFVSIIDGSKSAGEAFKEFAASILTEVAKMIIEFEILAAIKAALGFFSTAGGAAGATAGTAGEAPSGFSLVPAFKNQGGLIHGFSGGGTVPGFGPDRDSVPAVLTPGEFVVRRSIVQQPGILDMLQNLNAGASRLIYRAAGGIVGNAQLAGMSRGGDGQTVQPIVAIGDNEIDRLYAHPRFERRVMQVVIRNKQSIVS